MPLGMKSLLLRAVLVVLCMGCAHATLRIDGTALWSITKPDCTIEVVGAVQNLAPSSTISGSLKLALWVTTGPFPSPGVIVAEVDLGQLRGGTQISDFKRKVAVDMPDLTGDYYFSLVLMEYTVSGWFNRFLVPGSVHTIQGGVFLDDSQWRPKGGPFRRPPALVQSGQRLRLKTKANNTFTRITPGTEADWFITLEDEGKAELKRGSTTARADFLYRRGRDSLRGKRHRTGRISILTAGTRQAEVSLFFRTETKGLYRMAEGTQVAWGEFILR